MAADLFAAAVVSSSVQLVFETIVPVFVQKVQVFTQYKSELEKLKANSQTILPFLRDAERRKVLSESLQGWLRDLEIVAFEAEDIIDELSYRLLRKQVKRNERSRRKKVKMLFSRFNRISFRHRMSKRIKSLNEKLKLFNTLASEFGLNNMTAVSMHGDALTRETDSYYTDPLFLGREDDQDRIVEMLVNGEQQFSVVPISGMAGIGKTTLARHVFRNQRISEIFQIKIWVHVSQNFDALLIFKKILESLTENNEQFESREAILKNIQKKLGGKNYLLVLDDSWNEQRDKWDDFINSLSGVSCPKRNGIVLTTRSERVASLVTTVPIYKLSMLSDKVCWSIIQDRALKEGDTSPEFERTGLEIARKCQGLPLLANVLGGLFRDRPKEEWVSIQQSGLLDLGGDGLSTMNTLKLSFDYLPSPSVKRCFAYCSVFEKGFWIEKEILIEHWMAQGFLENNRGIEMEIVGDQVLDILVRASLLQRTDLEFISSPHYEMHDLLHDLAGSVLGVNGRLRYVHLTPDNFVLENSKTLRALILDGIEVSDDLFSDLESLRTLTLSNKNIETLPESIETLIHLRNLDIEETSIECMPNSIGSLYHLQTLRVNEGLSELPKTLTDLINLRHLYISHIALPPHVGRLTCLQTLPHFQVDYETGHRIEELGTLKNLKGEISIWNLEKVRDEEEAESAGLCQKPGLDCLKLSWDTQGEGTRNDASVSAGLCQKPGLDCFKPSWDTYGEGTRNDASVLEGLQPHTNLKDLGISGFQSINFPNWILKMEVRDKQQGCWIGLKNLKAIQLYECKCEVIPMLGHLPNLETVTLQSLPNVRSIGPSFYGIDKCSTRNGDKIVVFPALQELCLIDMPNLTELVTPTPQYQQHEVVGFPKLELLEMSGLPQFSIASNGFPMRIVSLQNLKSLALSMPSICGILDAFSLKLQSLCTLELEPVEHCDSLPECLQHLITLKELILRGFGIESFPEWFANLSSLQTLALENCEKLRHLPSKEAMKRLSNLNSLMIDSCPLLKLQETDGDSEYAKVSHIDLVYVDGNVISHNKSQS